MSSAIRGLGPTDFDQVDELLTAAFGAEAGDIVRLVHSLREHRCGRDRAEFGHVIDGRVGSHTMITRSRLDTDLALIEVPVLAPVSVRPDLHQQGFGSELVRHAISFATAASFPMLFVEGDPRYYSRFGFKPGGELGFRKPSHRIPDAAFQVRLLPAWQSWQVGGMVYAEPFWDHNAVGPGRAG